MYVYQQSERESDGPEGYSPPVFTVGFYAPDGHWHAESDHLTREAAAARVHYLNGGHQEG